MNDDQQPCVTCRALVRSSDMDKHHQWHERVKAEALEVAKGAIASFEWDATR